MGKSSQKIVFIDRDGVINKFPGQGKYVLNNEGMMVFGFVPDSLLKLKQAGFSIYIISNQACVSKGLLTEEQLKDITQYMLSLIEKDQKLITGVYYCIRQDSDDSPFRKPNPGMIEDILKKDKIDKDKLSDLPFFIGDSIRDVKTARNAGIRSILVLSGQEKLEDKEHWQTQPDYVCKDLSEAVDVILKGQ